MRFILKVLVLIFVSQSVMAQDLMAERIRRVPAKKRSIYFDSGIFHNGGPKISSTIKAVRHSYSESRGFERVVIDFETKEIPRIYGYISNQHKKVYLDVFNTKLTKNVGSFGKSKFVNNVDFYPIEDDSLSMEIKFKKNVNVDVFYLKGPGRLVIDIKG